MLVPGCKTWTCCLSLAVLVLSVRHTDGSAGPPGPNVLEIEAAPLPLVMPRIWDGQQSTIPPSNAVNVENSGHDHTQTGAEAKAEGAPLGMDLQKLEERRKKRGAWGMRRHAATVEATAYRLAGLGRPLAGWKRHNSKNQLTGALMSVLKELHTEKNRLLDAEQNTKGKNGEEEEEDDDDDEEDDDDDEEEEEEEEEEGEEGQEEEEEEGEEEEEEEEEEEGTEVPSNMTLAGFNSSLPEACQPTNGIISCRGMGLTYLPIISDLEVTQLDLAENNISHVAPAALSGLRLETLDLASNTLGDESLGPDALTNLTSLRKLNLDGNQITRVPAALPPSLVELKMNRNALNALDPHSFTGLGNLVSLELRDNSLDDSTVSPSAFEALESVRELHLDGNRLHSIPWGLPNTVQVLGLSNNLLEGVSTEALSGCVHLKKLDLSRNQLRDEAIASKAWIKLTALESLDLSFNHLGSIPENLPRSLLHLTIQHNTLRHIPGFSFRHLRPGLRTLRLSHNALGDKGVAHDSFVGAYRSLTELHLDDNGLTVVPLSVRQFKNLQALRLDGNHIRTVKRWALCPPRNAGSSLTSLHLENNLLREDRLPPKAFSCLPDPQGLVLQPQRAPTPDLL